MAITRESSSTRSNFGKTNLPELRKEIGWVSSSIQQQFHSYDTVLQIILSGKFASIGLYD